MLFDLKDYIVSGVIGPDSKCVDCNTWSDMWVTARQTKNAYFRSLFDWYTTSVDCLASDDPCRPAIDALWNKVLNFYDYYDDVWTKFWESLQCDGTFDDNICNQYRKAMIDLKCMVKQMMRLFDGDFIKTGTIPIT